MATSLVIMPENARVICERGQMLTRRKVLVVAASFGAATMVGVAQAQQDDMVTVRIRADQTARAVLQPIEIANLSIDPDNSPEAKELAGRAPASRAVPIFVIIAGAIALTELLKMIKELYRQTYYGGVLIDARPQPPLVTSDPRIPANMVFVVDHDGTTTQYKGDDFDVTKLGVSLK